MQLEPCAGWPRHGAVLTPKAPNLFVLNQCYKRILLPSILVAHVAHVARVVSRGAASVPLRILSSPSPVAFPDACVA